ncbi:MAG: protein kinase [Acidobacteriota bacterium]
MTLEAGSKLGPYEIVEPLGAGGMGEVYRARDTRLDREVAIKVLPEHLSNSPELRQRLEREAKSISSLQHPNICTLHDIGSDNGTDYLVMEYLDGETLDKRLAQGPLPIQELLSVGVSIADALDKAHRQGLAHRDLKPGNIMLTRGGAKLLDFGLAKGVMGMADPAALTQSPTMSPLTEEGTLVGTFQYMAPEQLEGEEADARSDIFAFGSVLYEMATGRRAFEGKTQASLIAAVLDREPAPISQIQPFLPPALDRVIRTCLAKDPDERFQNAHDIRLQLEWIRDAGSQAGLPAPVASRRKNREKIAWAVAAIFAVAAIAATSLLLRDTTPEPQVLRAEIAPAPDTVFDLNVSTPSPVSVSPDGRKLAWGALGPNGITTLWVRTLDDTTARQLDGTDSAAYPFWSPDSRFVAFFADGKLRKIDATGGPAITLCDAENGKGGTWNGAGEILFAPTASSPIHRVSAEGGEAQAVTQIDEAAGQNSHRHPRFLPDGEHFLYYTRVGAMGTAVEGSGVWLGSLGGDEPRFLLHTTSQAEYGSGYLLFGRSDAIMAQPFDIGARELRGQATPIVQGVVSMSGAAIAAFSVSNQGLLVYQMGGGNITTELTWYNRDGARLGILGEAATHTNLQLSPDQESVAVAVMDEETGVGEIWIYDVGRGVRSRFTHDPSETLFPQWSPDGSQIYFSSSRQKTFDIYRAAANGVGEEELILEGEGEQHPHEISPDGRFLMYGNLVGGGSTEWVLPLEGDEGPYPLVENEDFLTGDGQFSPNGKWVAYRSDETGRFEVYVAPFPGPGRKLQISSGGGGAPRWREDGKELYFLSSEGNLMSVEVDSEGDRFQLGEIRQLFDAPQLTSAAFDYVVTPDGERFLMNAVAEDSFDPITLVVNWTQELEKI